MSQSDHVRDTEHAPPPSSPDTAESVESAEMEFPREPMPTLPDGVPSLLWEEAVESERRLTIPSPPSWAR